jgi:hypothetical protein
VYHVAITGLHFRLCHEPLSLLSLCRRFRPGGGPKGGWGGGFHGGLGLPGGGAGPGWKRPPRGGEFGKPWRRPFARGFYNYNQPYGAFWGNGFQGDSVTNVYSAPETQRYEIAPELPVAVGGYRPVPVGAPVLYVIDTPQPRRNARVVDVGSVKPMGAPSIGADGDQTPRIVELLAR